MKERITARAVLLNEKNQIFLLKSVLPDETFWLTPGGQIEENETLLRAAQRELYEEVGIKNVQFFVPHSYYSEAVYMCATIPILMKEYFFIARTTEYKMSPELRSTAEKKEIIEGKWWDLNEFIASGETFYPRGLLEELKKVVYQDVLPQGTIIVSK